MYATNIWRTSKPAVTTSRIRSEALARQPAVKACSTVLFIDTERFDARLPSTRNRQAPRFVGLRALANQRASPAARAQDLTDAVTLAHQQPP